MGGSAGRDARRVAMVLGSSTGGIGRHVRSLVDGLVRQCDVVRVFCPSTTAQRFGFGAAGAQVVALEIPAGPGARDARVVSVLRAALRAQPSEVIHAHGLRAGLVAGLARPGGTPLVVTWHNLVLSGGWRAKALRLAERYVAGAAEVSLGASEDLVERVVALGGRDVRLGAVAAPLRETPRRSPEQVRAELDAAGRPLIVSVGRLHPQKGYDVLVAAAARWLARRPVVAIAGTGPSYRPLAAAILATRAPVRLLGHRDDVPDLLAAADLAVVTSLWEARQLFAQEALWAGVPLVATAVGGLPGLLGDAAVLVPPGDVDALDAAVGGLLDNPARQAVLAQAGKARAATWPTEADTITAVSAVYDEMIDRAAVTP
jgi:glycosyltransferase involved in cell wall biosynthesis